MDRTDKARTSPRSVASSYRISANQTEILKFISLDGNTIHFQTAKKFLYSLFVGLSKDNVVYSTLDYEQIRGLSKKEIQTFIYEITTNNYTDISPEFIVFDKTQDIFSDLYNLNQ